MIKILDIRESSRKEDDISVSGRQKVGRENRDPGWLLASRRPGRELAAVEGRPSALAVASARHRGAGPSTLDGLVFACGDVIARTAHSPRRRSRQWLKYELVVDGEIQVLSIYR
jgi:hypothetical protein